MKKHKLLLAVIAIVISIGAILTSCEKEENTLPNNSISSNYYSKELIIRDSINSNNIVLKLYCIDSVLLTKCNESNFTLISDKKAMQDYDAQFALEEEEFEEEEEGIDGIEPDLSSMDTLFIMDVISLNFEQNSGKFYFIKDLPFSIDETQLKSLCGSFAHWAHLDRWSSILSVQVTNTSGGICNDMKVRIWDKSPSYGWDPNDGTHSYQKTLTKKGSKTAVVTQSDGIAGSMAVCNSPRKNKNRWKVWYTPSYLND